jgi:hypothetical protein
VTLLILLLLGGAGAVAVWRYGPLTELLGQAAPTATPTATPTAAPTPSSPPVLRGPGLEPPVAGDWPSSWSKFSDSDPTTLMTLDGVGFPFRVPATWRCTQRVSSAPGGVSHSCGVQSGVAVSVGGDLNVHPCPDGCDSDQRLRMRQTEDAWGLQWTRAGAYVTWAQTSALPAPAQYGLVVIGYWRSAPEGPINRQVVLRLTAPKDQAADLQKVANDVFTKIS